MMGEHPLGEPPSSPPADLDRWFPLVYEELRGLAGHLLRDKGAAVTIEPTSLVHEAYLRLLGQRRLDWHDRLHFLRIAARIMRRVLVDHCRGRLAQKRGGAQVVLDLEEVAAATVPRPIDILVVDRSLSALEAFDPQQAQLVELRFFSGLTIEETAEALGISKATVKREWALAKAWLARDLARSA